MHQEILTGPLVLDEFGNVNDIINSAKCCCNIRLSAGIEITGTRFMYTLGQQWQGHSGYTY